jgi:DNA-binding transcriptional LysR family regulator
LESVELRHLRYFIAVAERLSFSRAAEDLATAQPSLSQQIRQLEADVGVELFEREKRQIALTAAGRELLGDARAIVASVSDAVARARETARGVRGELRIGYATSAMVSTLPSVIHEYRQLQPDVRITLRAMGPIAILAALEAREVDVGVFVADASVRSGPAIVARRVGSLALALAVPTGHPLARRRTVSVRALEAEHLIAYARGLTDMYDTAIGIFRDRGVEPARIVEVDRMETLLGLVAAGEGVAIVPRVYETLGFGGVRYLALSPVAPALAIIAASPRQGRSPLARDFVDLCERLGRTVV